jgi:putative endonuclease
VTPAKKTAFIRRGTFTVYMLQCRGGGLYTGYTHDLDARLKLHRSGKGSKYVRSRLPCKLVYTREYSYFRAAVLEEIRIKALTRDEKLALVKKGRRLRAVKREALA